MKTLSSRLLTAALLSCSFFNLAKAQDAERPAYLDTSLSPEQRAADLVKRMTLEEKATQLVNQARAIPRLKVPAYDWWSESLHGVAVNGTTEFPEPIGLAATFDTEAIHKMAEVISTEGRIKHMQALKANGGSSNIFQGLDFWAPNINIFRDPRWGRGQETYGEDPFLTGRMAVAFVTGMQGDNPKYYRVISTPKHYVVHSGPEPTRHFADVDVSKHDEMDTYLPAFRAAVTEGHAGSVMCSYNAINGEPGCANRFTLIDQLRNKWGFNGYVVSDCGAVLDIFSGHHFRPTQAQSSGISLERGMDNECADFFSKVNDDHDYKPYIDAVQQGYLRQGAIDQALVRLFSARIKLGMFDPPAMVPYTKIDEKLLDSAGHRAMARKVAEESMVLLKNDGTLPLKPESKNIVIVGPLADQTKVLLGNYNGIPTHTVSFMEGLQKELPNAKITYVPGTQFLRPDGKPLPANLLTTPDGKPGLKAEYGQGLSFGTKPTPITERVEANVDLNETTLPAEAKGKAMLAVQWSGFLTPAETGDYLIGTQAESFAMVTIAERPVSQQDGGGTSLGRVHLEKGQKVALQVIYGVTPDRRLGVRLLWTKADNTPSPAALEAARKADVVIAVVGITSELEGEEMPVSEPGFLGGDRTSLDLPQPEEELVQSVAQSGKPLVVVLMNGSALSVNWEKAHANAILEAWYSGEEGGAAIAETLSGKNNPAGRLPVTFYTGVDQLPHFENYSMEGRTYRYFKSTPLYPFGYGLSYTSFEYKDLNLPTNPVPAGAAMSASVTVSNRGRRAGDEVAQLYLSFPNVPGAPIRALRAFQRVHLEPGESQTLHFDLKPRDLSMVTDAGDPIVAAGQYKISIGGGQPDTGVPAVAGTFQIDGSVSLPE
jgi:beta-glucosidase